MITSSSLMKISILPYLLTYTYITNLIEFWVLFAVYSITTPLPPCYMRKLFDLHWKMKWTYIRTPTKRHIIFTKSLHPTYTWNFILFNILYLSYTHTHKLIPISYWKHFWCDLVLWWCRHTTTSFVCLLRYQFCHFITSLCV